MAHHHHSSTKTLLIAVIIVAFFAIVEALGGYFSNSLTLLSDAGHMTADVFGLSLASIAAWFAQRPATKRHSYGLGRIEVIVATLSSLILILLVIGIGVEAIERLNHPRNVHGAAVMVIATLGLIVNISVAWVLHRGEQNLNTRAAFLHVISDLLGSIAALLSGIIIYWTHWELIDPILSMVICILIFLVTLRLLKDAFLVLMEGVPKNLDLNEIGQTIAKIEHIQSVHDVHVWTLSSNKLILSAHVQVDELKNWPEVLRTLKLTLSDQFQIEHITIQPEVNEETLSFISR